MHLQLIRTFKDILFHLFLLFFLPYILLVYASFLNNSPSFIFLPESFQSYIASKIFASVGQITFALSSKPITGNISLIFFSITVAKSLTDTI